MNLLKQRRNKFESKISVNDFVGNTSREKQFKITKK